MSHDVRELVRAIRAGDENALRNLLRRDAELARKPRAIVEAARLARPAVLRLLLRRGADPNGSYRGYRPLHALIQERPHAASGENPPERRSCLDLLLEAGADPEQLGAYPPARALLVAAFTGLPPMVAALRRAGARVDGFVRAALGHAGHVARLLERDPSFAVARDRGGLTALQCAAASRLGHGDARVRRGLLDAARALLDAGADAAARTKGWSHEVDTAYFAASAGQRELFELLLECGADATAALPSAVWNAPIDLAELALDHGAEPDRARHEGRPLLNDLVRWGQVDKALWLLERGASPNVRDERGWTAVHQAASRGNVRLLAALLDARGDRRVRDRRGRTPLDVARARGRPRVVALLG